VALRESWCRASSSSDMKKQWRSKTRLAWCTCAASPCLRRLVHDSGERERTRFHQAFPLSPPSQPLLDPISHTSRSAVNTKDQCSINVIERRTRRRVLVPTARLRASIKPDISGATSSHGAYEQNYQDSRQLKAATDGYNCVC
jgi:hypothetical protein